MPLVSSYTWIVVRSPRIRMTSPMSCSLPTSMTSYIRGRSPVAVTTGPATRWISPASAFPLAAIRFTSLEQVDADRALHLRPEVLLFLGPDRDHHGPRHRLEALAGDRVQPPEVLRAHDEDAYVRVLDDLVHLPLERLGVHGVHLPHPRELEPE